MPPQDRVRCNDRCQLLQQLSAKLLALHSQTSTLVIGEQNPLLPKLFFQNLVLGPQVLDHLLLLLVDPVW